MEQGASSTDPCGQAGGQATTPFTLILPVHPSTQCALHKKLREIYCETHQTAICVSCAYNDHRPPICKTVLLEDKTELDRKALRDLLPTIESRLKELQDKHDRATARQTDAEERYEAEEQKIQAWREAITDELEEECERLVKQLHDSLEQKIGEVNKVADSNNTSLCTTWSKPLDTLQTAASSSKKGFDELDRNIALGAATADDSAATSDAIEAVKQDLLESVKWAREFLMMAKDDVAVPELLKLHEHLGLGLKVVAVVSSKDASTSTEGESDGSMLKEELRTCKERLQTCEEETRTHRMSVAQLRKELSALQSTGAAEARRLREDKALLTAELKLKTKDVEHANMRAEEMEADKLRTEQLIHDLRQGIKDLERKLESSKQPEASSATVSQANDAAACQESPELLELRRIAKSKSGWKKRVVRKDRVLKLTGDNFVVINGPWIRAALDFLTGKTNTSPGPVNFAPPAHDRSDYYCVNSHFEDKLFCNFDTLEGQWRFEADKDDDIPIDLMNITFKKGTSRQEALTCDDGMLAYIDIDDTFQEYCERRDSFRILQVYVVGGSPLSPHKTVRHYLENTNVKLHDFTTLLFVGNDI